MAVNDVFVLLVLANIFVVLSVSAVPKKKEVLLLKCVRAVRCDV